MNTPRMRKDAALLSEDAIESIKRMKTVRGGAAAAAAEHGISIRRVYKVWEAAGVHVPKERKKRGESPPARSIEGGSAGPDIEPAARAEPSRSSRLAEFSPHELFAIALHRDRKSGKITDAELQEAFELSMARALGE